MELHVYVGEGVWKEVLWNNREQDSRKWGSRGAVFKGAAKLSIDVWCTFY